MKRFATVTIVVLLCIGGVPLGADKVLAFVEGPSNNFFGDGAGDDPGNTGTANSFFGGSSGTSNTTGAENSFFGTSAGFSNTTGSLNAFFGFNAGGFNTTGGSNAFFGAGAGFVNTLGSSNAFFGRDAGLNNDTCCNSFFGRDSGRANTTGSFNSFFGTGAGFRNTTACCNAFFGEAAGFQNTTGHSNSFFGRDAGSSNTTGSLNAFFGISAGSENTGGSFNSFFGRGAGVLNTDGDDNSFFGRGAGRANNTGFRNSFFGAEAGLSNTSENANSFLGAFSNGAVGITNATAVGNQAQVSQSDSLVLGSINGLNSATSDTKVGIGTPSPASALHVRRAVGTAKVLVEEASPILQGRELFELSNNGAARFRVRNTSNNATWDFQSSSGGGSFVIDRVGGDPSLDFEMQPDGDLVVRGSVTGTGFITSSDRNLKTDITPANARSLTSLLNQLDISTWRFKSQPEGPVNLGPMAQDFHRLFGLGTKTTIDVRDLAALALVAAQMLDDENAEQKRINEAQQEQIDELQRQMASVR